MGTATVTATATSNHGRKNKKQKAPVPKGYLAVKVGETDDEQKRFVVPVIWLNHPLFKQLLKVAEDKYGFEQPGTITIPCTVHHFRTVVGRIIDHKQPHQHFGCFRVWAR